LLDALTINPNSGSILIPVKDTGLFQGGNFDKNIDFDEKVKIVLVLENRHLHILKHMDYHDFDMELKQHLDSDEKLLWTGAPKQGILLRGSDVLMIPFSLMFGGFALFWEFGVVSSGASLFFVLGGIPFVLMGLYLIFGRFIYDSKLRKSTIYGITQHRIIIKSGVFKSSVKSLNVRTLTGVTLNEQSDGSGTILLGSERGINEMFRGTGWPGAESKMVPALELLHDAKRAYRQIIDLQKDQ
jgi:hypothetical protein